MAKGGGFGTSFEVDMVRPVETPRGTVWEIHLSDLGR